VSKFSGQNKVAVVSFADPTADAVIPVLKAPSDHDITIEAAYAVSVDGVAADATDIVSLNLVNAGTSGTATTSISGTAGGTAGWTANVAQSMAVTAGSGVLSAGQYLGLNYNEGGTVAPLNFIVMIEYVDGIGASANA
jgi:hypothetical protein